MNGRKVVWITVSGLTCAATLAIWSLNAAPVRAHCQVPCGIYDDPARVALLREDAKTIEKAMVKIEELAGAHEAVAVNQVGRWISTKEDHASHIIDVVANYFMAQRVKPKDANSEGRAAYLSMLADHHGVIVAAMKTKQSINVADAHALQKAIDLIGMYYEK